MEHRFFYLAASFMLLHEMDAVRCREWQIFPGLSLLEEEVGFQVFMLAHLPLYGLFFWAVMGQGTTSGVIRGLDLFLSCIWYCICFTLLWWLTRSGKGRNAGWLTNRKAKPPRS
jgi:hypothetical protein